MKRQLILLILLLILSTKIIVAQDVACSLINTKWKIKDVKTIITNGTVKDSLFAQEFYKKYGALRIDFYSKGYLIVLFGKYKIQGKYKIKRTGEKYLMDVDFKRREFNFYENGSLERANFASFLYNLKNDLISFLDNCFFVMLIKRKGIESRVYFERSE